MSAAAARFSTTMAAPQDTAAPSTPQAGTAKTPTVSWTVHAAAVTARCHELLPAMRSTVWALPTATLAIEAAHNTVRAGAPWANSGPKTDSTVWGNPMTRTNRGQEKSTIQQV